MGWQLAQANVARLAAPLESPALAPFMAALGSVDAAARRAPGFVWRPLDAQEADTERAFLWDLDGSVGMILNLSVWESVATLRDFVYGNSLHVGAMRQRRDFFVPMAEAHDVCWWIPSGSVPTWEDAEARMRSLRSNGSSAAAFSLISPYPAPC